MIPCLNYGQIFNGAMYYPGSEKGGLDGLIDMEDPEKKWNFFCSKSGTGKGLYVEIVTGIGAKSSRPFSPLTKSLWLIIADFYGFEIASGYNYGTLRLNVSHVYDKGVQFRELGVALMLFATRRDRGNYSPEFANQDFGVLISEVCYKQEYF